MAYYVLARVLVKKKKKRGPVVYEGERGDEDMGLE